MIHIPDVTAIEAGRNFADLLVDVREHRRPRGAHDLVIAATAAVTQRILATADPSALADLPGVSIRRHR